MKINIERLLRLTADFDLFQGDRLVDMGQNSDPDELSAEELDFAAAAGTYAALYGQLTEDDLI